MPLREYFFLLYSLSNLQSVNCVRFAEALEIVIKSMLSGPIHFFSYLSFSLCCKTQLHITTILEKYKHYFKYHHIAVIIFLHVFLLCNNILRVRQFTGCIRVSLANCPPPGVCLRGAGVCSIIFYKFNEEIGID